MFSRCEGCRYSDWIPDENCSRNTMFNSGFCACPIKRLCRTQVTTIRVAKYTNFLKIAVSRQIDFDLQCVVTAMIGVPVFASVFVNSDSLRNEKISFGHEIFEQENHQQAKRSNTHESLSMNILFLVFVKSNRKLFEDRCFELSCGNVDPQAWKIAMGASFCTMFCKNDNLFARKNVFFDDVQRRTFMFRTSEVEYWSHLETNMCKSTA